MSHDQESRGRRTVVVALFVVIGALACADIVEDVRLGESAAHVLVEMAVMACAFAGALLMGLNVMRVGRQVRTLRRDLEQAQIDADMWRTEAQGALEGLGVAIQRQFERWDLTPAEAEVALLLLKGLSHKEVGDVRQTSERTIRHQALCVYRKAGLAGRAELSAFFLEDLLLPAEPASRAARRAG